MYDFQTHESAPAPAGETRQSAFQRARSLVHRSIPSLRGKRGLLGIGVGGLLIVGLAATGFGGRGPSLAKKASNLLVGGKAVDLEQMPKKLAEVYCKALLECNSAPELAARFEGADEKSTCIAANTIRFREETLAGMLDAQQRGAFQYNPAFAGKCLESLEEKGCGVLGYSLFEICTDTFVGKSDDECLHEYECAPSERCELTSQCPGTCVPKSELSQPCRMAQDCKGGLFCSDLSFSCEPIRHEGESCKADENPGQCAEGLFCSEGKCTSNEKSYTKKQGEWCGEEGLCQEGMSCTVSFTHNECAPIVGAGETCHTGVPSQCAAGFFCTADPDAGKWQGTCEPKLQAGSSCSAAEQCDPSLECIEGACTKLVALGEACSKDQECYSSRCTGGKCQAPEPCVPEEQRVARSSM